MLDCLDTHQMAYQNGVLGLGGIFKAIFYTFLVIIYLKFSNSDGVLKYFTSHWVKCQEDKKSSRPVREE